MDILAVAGILRQGSQPRVTYLVGTMNGKTFDVFKYVVAATRNRAGDVTTIKLRCVANENRVADIDCCVDAIQAAGVARAGRRVVRHRGVADVCRRCGLADTNPGTVVQGGISADGDIGHIECAAG